jgi:cytoskeletal protein CcmA (bactofilin family)
MNFRAKKTAADHISGFLDREASLTGELEFAGTLRIDGNFHGSISTNDILIVGEHAMVHADVKVGEIEIHGQVFGSIDAKRRVKIYETGRVRGDLLTPVLAVNPGAMLDGRTSMATASADDSNLVPHTVATQDSTSKEKQGVKGVK